MEAVRSVVQPITLNLPSQVKDVGIQLLGVACYKQLILDVDISNPDCVKLAVSKALGSGIVAVSAIVKLPQLYNLMQSQSAAGVSFLSYALETTAYVVTLAYNARMGNPFSTYGENAFIAAQNVAIASLVLHYTGKDAGAVAFIAALAGGLYSMFDKNLVDLNTMGMLQAGAGVLGVASKLPQIFTIWSEGGTGQLSSFAVSLLELLHHMLMYTRCLTFCLARYRESLRLCRKSMIL
jgi:mannose-P-dolichol utilization defect 1